MLERIIKDYFSFTRKERIAIIVLVVLTLVISLLPYYIPEKEEKLDLAGFDTIRLKLAQSEPVNELQTESFIDYGNKSFNEGKRPYTRALDKEEPPSKGEMFSFDPNSLSREGWKRLGLRDKTIETIHKYISRGGRFNNKEDIGKIYGLHPAEIKRLLPYVKIESKNTAPNYHTPEPPSHLAKSTENYYSYKRTASAPALIDINTADSTQLISLPGIGSKLAARILHFREKLGGFYSVNQLSETYGLADSVFQKISPRLTISQIVEPFININMARENEMNQHPYIRHNIATAIIQYRAQHGNFKSLEDLRKIDLITREIFEKVRPYLKVE